MNGLICSPRTAVPSIPVLRSPASDAGRRKNLLAVCRWTYGTGPVDLLSAPGCVINA